MHAGAHVPLASAAPALRIVSTDGVHASERREFWESGGGFLFGALELDQCGGEPFDACFSYARLGDLTFGRLAARVSHRAIRTQAVARRDDRPFLKAVLQRKGRSAIAQGGASTSLQAGEWTIYDAGEPYSVALTAGAEFSLILVPREKIVTRGCDLRRLVLRPVSARRGFGRLMWNLFDTTIEEIPGLPNRCGLDVAELVAQMFRVALFDSWDGPVPLRSRDALRERLKFYISAHLRDHELDIARLAERTRCSKRYLHMIFRMEGISISEYILKLRLERCRAELLDPAGAHRSIAEIACAWGFDSPGHFSRRFKRQFGVSPREVRARVGLWPHGSAGGVKPC